jgi:hypothetical protein
MSKTGAQHFEAIEAIAGNPGADADTRLLAEAVVHAWGRMNTHNANFEVVRDIIGRLENRIKQLESAVASG